MDWNNMNGNLLTGDCKGFIHQWKKRESTWEVDKTPYKLHDDSVEDLQWSPIEPEVNLEIKKSYLQAVLLIKTLLCGTAEIIRIRY